MGSPVKNTYSNRLFIWLVVYSILLVCCVVLIVLMAIPHSVPLSELLKADKGFIWILSAVTVVMCTLGYFATRRVGLIERLSASLQKAITERDREHAAAMHEQQEKERIKKQLTNNINHELKTPVASIQVCLETLLSHPDMSKEKRMEFLSRCQSNSQRLQQLLADVSLITRLDEGAGSIAKEDIDLMEIIRGVVEEKTDDAARKGIVIQNDIVRPIELKGNKSLWESVFYNLIDNAISYSGGDRIVVRRIPFSGDNTIITVCDNGRGVPEEHIPRLFERFYRVDKGRSRAVGGTGLGLSIVKNAVQLHGGSISVCNVPHGGLCFKITLK